MDIDKACKDAKKRLQHALDQTVNRHLREMRTKNGRVVTITVRDREHFYALVKWCNTHCGKGSHNWTVPGRVLRYVDPKKAAYNPPRVANWIILKPGVDISPLLAL